MCKRRRKPLSGLRRRRRHMLTRHVAREYRQGGRGSPLNAYASVSIPDPVYGTENESDEKLMSEQEDDVAQLFFSFLPFLTILLLLVLQRCACSSCSSCSYRS